MTYPDLPALVDAFCEAYDNPALKPSPGVTHCNSAVAYIARQMGYPLFDGLVANQIVAQVMESRRWQKMTDLLEAQHMANEGYLVLAGTQGTPHGHVCVVRPGYVTHSPKWGCDAPKACNVGSVNFISKSLNWAFAERPSVWVLQKEA